MDAVKQAIADAVGLALRMPGFVGDLYFMEGSVEVTKITDLQTQVKVRTANGPRYFVVQVKEQM